MFNVGHWSAAAHYTGADPSWWPLGTRTAEDEARVAAYATALAFYQGNQWQDRARRGESRLVFNYARAVIRKTASYVFPAPVSFTAMTAEGDHAREAGNRAERLLISLANRSEWPALETALAVDALVLGDAAIKVTWDARTSRPGIAAVDPGSLVACCAPDDPHVVERMTHVYGLAGTQLRRVFPEISLAALSDDRIWPVAEMWTADSWTLQIAGQTVREIENPYGWIPYVIAANRSRPFSVWGESDLVDVVDVCQEINRRMTVLGKILELSGAPIAVLENVQGSEGIAVGPGAKWELPEGARAYLLDLLQGGGSQLHLGYIDRLFQILHDLTETPRTAFGDSGRDLSGAALEVEIQPLVQKVARIRRMWDGVFAKRNAMVLDLCERFGGIDLGEVRETVTIWLPVLPGDREAAVRNVVSLVANGIQSRRSAMAALGNLDPETELAHIRTESDVFAPNTPDGKAELGAGTGKAPR